MIYIFMSIILSLINFIVCKKDFKNFIDNEEYKNIKESDFKFIYLYPILMIVLFAIQGANVFTLFIVGITPLLLMHIITDMREKELSDIVTLTILINATVFLALCFFVFNFPFKIIIEYAFTASIMFIIYLVIAVLGNAMGGGDVKLIGALGLFFRASSIPELLMYPFLIGSIYGLYLIIFKKEKLKNHFAFGPFIILGFYIITLI